MVPICSVLPRRKNEPPPGASALSTTTDPSIVNVAWATELTLSSHGPLTSGVNVVENRAENPGSGGVNDGSIGSAIHISRLVDTSIERSGAAAASSAPCTSRNSSTRKGVHNDRDS